MINQTFEIQHTSHVRVRYADTDKMGIVYNGKYFEFFEVGRTELMRNCGLPYTEFEKAGYILPLTETYASFVSPAHYDDILDIKAVLKVEYKPLIRFDYNIFRADTTIAIGYTVHTFLSAKTRGPVKPPKMFFDALAAYKGCHK